MSACGPIVGIVVVFHTSTPVWNGNMHTMRPLLIHKRVKIDSISLPLGYGGTGWNVSTVIAGLTRTALTFELVSSPPAK